MPQKQSFHVLINDQSGAVLKLGKDVIEQKIASSNIEIESLHILPPDHFFQHLKRMNIVRRPFLIGGGDGTIRSAADIAMQNDLKLGILPLGTMNLLALDLGIPNDIDEALAHYADETRTEYVDVGVINNKTFLCCASIGTIPQASEFREEHRDKSDVVIFPRLTNYVMKQMDRIAHHKLYVDIDGRVQKLMTAALVISNNQFNKNAAFGYEQINRASLQDSKLGVYSVAPKTMWDKIRIMFRLVWGKWQKDPNIQSWEGEKVSIKTEGNTQTIALDGEITTMSTPLNFRIKPLALGLVVPKKITMECA